MKKGPTPRRIRCRTKEFAEPVSLSSTVSADFRLPPTAAGFGFDLLALRARRIGNLTCREGPIKAVKSELLAICESFNYQHFHSDSCSLWTQMWITIQRVCTGVRSSAATGNPVDASTYTARYVVGADGVASLSVNVPSVPSGTVATSVRVPSRCSR
jgi:hypothetical protein